MIRLYKGLYILGKYLSSSVRIYVSVGVVMLLVPSLLLSGAFPVNQGSSGRQSPLHFKEVWGYLLRGGEKNFKGSEPVTDIFYFSCNLNSKGRISINVKPPKLPPINGKKRRVHIVISEIENRELTRRVLNPDSSVRDYLIDDILEVSAGFDGVQIDFEAVAKRDRGNFIRFLELVKMGLDEGKIFSVALPARIKRIPGDQYDYSAISKIADKVFIMAYDQHWSRGNPGPVAALSWCGSVVAYAKDSVPGEKLVMGIPLYGRAWYNRNESCSISVGQAKILLAKKSAVSGYTPEYGIKITFRDSDVIVFYDDINATRQKLALYRNYVNAVGFWRLGMDKPGLWQEITIRD